MRPRQKIGYLLIALVATIALLTTANTHLSATSSRAPAGPPPTPPPGPASDASLAIHPLSYAPGALDNPMKGFLPFYDPANDFATAYPHSMEWAYIALSEIMTNATNCSAYNWTILDQILNGIASHGNQAAIRVYLQYPNGGTGTHPQDGTPPCLNGRVAMRWDNFWSINTPDYDDPDMIQALQGFINAFGARYDGDARLGSIHMGLIGLWGEWHTWPYDSDTSDGLPNYFPTNATVRTIIDTYVAAFSRTKLVIRYPDLAGGYASQAAIGFADDSWGFNEGSPPQSITLPQSMGGASYAFLQLALNAGGENKWIDQMIGGEARPEIQQIMFPQYWPNGTAGVSGVPNNVSNLLASVELTHISWMMNQQGMNYSPSDPKVAEAIRKIGYELFVKNAYFNANAPAGGQFKVGVQIENYGVARFYYPWKMILGLKNSSGTVVKTWDTTWDITKVQPLQIRKFPDWNNGTGYMPFGSPYYYDATLSASGIANGTYAVVLRVQNPLELTHPQAKKLRFANQTQNSDGWLGLGNITISSSVPTNTPVVATATRTSTPVAGGASYEAESPANTLSGGAAIAVCSACSGGQKVGYVGNNSGILQFNGISASSAGARTLTIYYLNGTTPRTTQMSINGGAASTLNFPSTGSWDTVGSITITVTLNAGNNTIRFFNSTAGSWSPDFDRIAVGGAGVTPTNTPAPTFQPPTNTPSQGSASYEAESTANALSGGAVIAACSACSGGQKVGYVGNNSGILQFNGISASSAGARTLTIYYLNGTTPRTTQMSVNGGAASTLNFPSTGSWDTVGSITITVTLNAGSNTIRFFNNTVGAWGPDFDRLVVSG